MKVATAGASSTRGMKCTMWEIFTIVAFPRKVKKNVRHCLVTTLSNCYFYQCTTQNTGCVGQRPVHRRWQLTSNRNSEQHNCYKSNSFNGDRVISAIQCAHTSVALRTIRTKWSGERQNKTKEKRALQRHRDVLWRPCYDQKKMHASGIVNLSHQK